MQSIAKISPTTREPAIPVAVAIKQGVVAGTKAAGEPSYGTGTGFGRPTPAALVIA